MHTLLVQSILDKLHCTPFFQVINQVLITRVYEADKYQRCNAHRLLSFEHCFLKI